MKPSHLTEEEKKVIEGKFHRAVNDSFNNYLAKKRIMLEAWDENSRNSLIEAYKTAFIAGAIFGTNQSGEILEKKLGEKMDDLFTKFKDFMDKDR